MLIFQIFLLEALILVVFQLLSVGGVLGELRLSVEAQRITGWRILMFETDDSRLRLWQDRRLLRRKLDLFKQLHQIGLSCSRALSILHLLNFLLLFLRTSHVLWKGIELALVCGR